MNSDCSKRLYGSFIYALTLLVSGVVLGGCDASVTSDSAETTIESDRVELKSPGSEVFASSAPPAGADALTVPEADLPIIDLSPRPSQPTPATASKVPPPEAATFAGLSEQAAGQLFQELTQAPDFSQVDVVAVPNASTGSETPDTGQAEP